MTKSPKTFCTHTKSPINSKRSSSGKSVTFTDSVQETKMLSEVVEKLNGKIVGIYEYLFNQDKVDIVVCNRKCYIKAYETETTLR